MSAPCVVARAHSRSTGCPCWADGAPWPEGSTFRSFGARRSVIRDSIRTFGAKRAFRAVEVSDQRGGDQGRPSKRHQADHPVRHLRAKARFCRVELLHSAPHATLVSMKLYVDLAEWWPIFSAPEDYKEEADFVAPPLTQSGAPRPPRRLAVG